MEHILQFGISIDEEKIKEVAQSNYDKYYCELIDKYIRDAILDNSAHRNLYSSTSEQISEGIMSEVRKRIDNIVAQNKDVIIEKASDKLVKSIRMCKKGKEIFDKLEQEVNNEIGGK